MEEKNLKLQVDQRIAVVTVDRPQALNALNAATLDELEALFGRLAQDPEIGAVILTGAGEKAFVAGADLKELARLSAVQARRTAARGQAVFAAIEDFPKPVIAAVNGFCLGGGCELAMSCHIRIASDNARFGQPEVKLGLTPGYGGTQRLPRLVGKGRALELILSGQMIDADEAFRIGLVNRVVAFTDLLAECRKLAAKILANAPLALSLSIEAVNRGMDIPLSEALALEAALFGVACSSHDMREGTSAFLEKRPPRFQGQ